MTRLKFLIAGLFAIALVSGVLVGMGVSRTAHVQDRREWVAEILNLSPQQKTDMENIWSDDRTRRQNVSERTRLAQKERDDAVQSLFTPEQKITFGQIDAKYKDQMAELNHERDQAFLAAVESTKALLTDAQRAKYDELLKSGFRGGRDGPPGWRGPSTRRGGPAGAPETATTAPATAPGSGSGLMN